MDDTKAFPILTTPQEDKLVNSEIRKEVASFDLATLYAALIADPNIIYLSTSPSVQIAVRVSVATGNQGQFLYAYDVKDQATTQGTGLTPAQISATVGINMLEKFKGVG